jgi:hydroxyacyl-ACP dehydratase HTD2-like protein with hotdog domain
MTITAGLSGPLVDEALVHSLQKERNSVSFECRGLAYIFPNEQFCFHLEKIFPLKDIKNG